MGRFARSEDHVHDVLARLVDRLGRHERRGLGLYAPWRERNPDKTFEDWIQIVTVNEIRRLVRAELARLATSDAEALPSVKRVLNEIAMSPALEELGVRPAMTAAQTARELVVFAEARLPADRYRALRLWMEGASFDEIAAELGLGPTEAAVAQRLVRAALGVVRRHFAAETDEEINS
jgi:DNA-directed RNA polymerase specialized sigma24 family protein